MKINLPLPQDKKLTILFRVEAGCLGPNGTAHIENFCKLAQQQLAEIDSDFVCWQIVPRHNKSLPEIQYQINNKNLSADKADQFLRLFDKNRLEFEDNFNKKLSLIIDQFLGY